MRGGEGRKGFVPHALSADTLIDGLWDASFSSGKKREKGEGEKRGGRRGGGKDRALKRKEEGEKSQKEGGRFSIQFQAKRDFGLEEKKKREEERGERKRKRKEKKEGGKNHSLTLSTCLELLQILFALFR